MAIYTATAAVAATTITTSITKSSHPSLLSFSSSSTLKPFSSSTISHYPSSILSLSSHPPCFLTLSPRASSSSSSSTQPMLPPYNVLITGSTKGQLPTWIITLLLLMHILYLVACFSHSSLTGIGYALAKEFLNQGDNVVVCSRSGTRLLQLLLYIFIPLPYTFISSIYMQQIKYNVIWSSQILEFAIICMRYKVLEVKY